LQKYKNCSYIDSIPLRKVNFNPNNKPKYMVIPAGTRPNFMNLWDLILNFSISL